MEHSATGESAARYKQLIDDRSVYLAEAAESAHLTIPALMPDTLDITELTKNTRILEKPWQSLGARGVNNLASKLLLTLFPPNNPFFRYQPSAETLAEIPQEELESVKSDLQQKLAKRERIVVAEVDAQALRVKLFEVLKQLLVAGNVLLYSLPGGGLKVVKLNAYVVKRDVTGNVLEIVVAEVLDRLSVSEEVREIISDDVPEDAAKTGSGNQNSVTIYTHIRLIEGGKGRYKVTQEVAGELIPSANASFGKDDLPWLALRFVALDGEDYGRGFVEEYRGDLLSLEEISHSLVLAALNAARVIPMVDPNGTAKIRVLRKAKNGEFISGRAEDVTFLKLDKNADMQVALEEKRDLTQALSADFMLNSSFQRQAERVTAEEIRKMAEELEDTLGGVFSLLSQELQLPLAKRLEQQLIRRGALKALPKGTVTPTVVTGLAAIGRGQDLARLQTLVQMVADLAPVFPDLPLHFNTADIATRLVTGTGVDPDGLQRSAEEVAQEKKAAQQAAQQQMMMDKAVGPFADAAAPQLVAQMLPTQEGEAPAAPPQ